MSHELSGFRNAGARLSLFLRRQMQINLKTGDITLMLVKYLANDSLHVCAKHVRSRNK